MIQADDQAPLIPKLNVMTVNKLPGPLGSVGVICADKSPVADKMPVGADGVRPIFLHGFLL
jgi:hypothetical protein